jgi:hypothetical protein
LTRCSRKSFNRYFSTILQFPLNKNSKRKQVLYRQWYQTWLYVLTVPCILDQNHPVQVCWTSGSCLWQLQAFQNQIVIALVS